jgi:hypothetical protein
MRRNRVGIKGPLGAVAFGLLAALASGCSGSDGRDEAGPDLRSQASKITARSVEVDGCTATAVFDIQSAQAIQFVALDRSDLQNVRMELSTLDERGLETRIEENAVEADELIQSMIDAQTSNMNAAEASKDEASQSQKESSSTTTTESEESSSRTETRDSSSSSTNDKDSAHQDQSEASRSDERASDGSNASSTTGTTGSVSGSNRQSSSASSASQSSSSNQTSDSSHEAISKTSHDAVAIDEASASRVVQSAESAASDSSSASSDSSSRNEASSNQHNEQEQARSSSSHTLVFRNLERLNSRNLVLRVEMQANEVNEVMRLFEGDEQIRARADFATSFPGCAMPAGSTTVIR